MSVFEYLGYSDNLGKWGTCLTNQAFSYEKHRCVIIAHLSGLLLGFKCVNCECVI